MRTASPLAATVAICTANRAARLGETLLAVLSIADPAMAEIVVVDNGSTDRTPALLAEVAASHPGRLRAVREERAGLSAARNRAVREARGDLLLFLDDDALPGSGWIEAYSDAFRDPAVLAAGGPVAPLFDGPLPDWLDARFLPYLSAWNRGTEIGSLTYNELPRGANMAFRRSTFAAFGEFLEQLGRRGRSLRSCEEIEYCLRLERGGGRILYLPGAPVRHHVATERLSVEWMCARFAAQGFSEAILDWRHAGPRGLRTGLARVARTVSSAGSDTMGRCQRAGARGYRRGALYAALAVARYQPPEPMALARFEPFG